MIEPNCTLGDISSKVNSMFLQGKGLPNIIIIPKKTSFLLWSIRTSSLVAVFGGRSKLGKEIEIVKITKFFESKQVFILLGFQCGIIQLWKLNLNQLSVSCIFFKGHQTEIFALSQRLEKSFFVSGCKKGNIVNWKISKKKGVFRIKTAHNNGVTGLKIIEFFKKKRFAILSCGNDSLIKFWDSRSGLCLRIFELSNRFISSLDFFSETRNLMVSTESGKIPIFSVSEYLDLKKIGQLWRFSRTKRHFLKTNKPNSVVFLFNNKGDIEVTILNAEKIFSQTKREFEFKPDRKFLDFKTPITFSLNQDISGIDLWQNSKNGKILILIHFSRTNILEILEFSFQNINNKNKTFSLVKIFREKLASHSGEIRSILWFSNDTFIVSLEGTSRTIQMWYWVTQTRTNIIRTFSRGICFCFCGANTVAIGGKTGNIEIYDLFSNKLIWSKTEAHSGPIWSLDTAPNFLILGTGGSDGVLKFWEFETNKASLSKKLLTKDQILGLKIVSRGNLFVVCGISSKISVFNLKTLQFLFSLIGHSLPVITLGLCDDSDFVGTGSADYSIKIWSLKERKELKTLISENTAVTAFNFQRHSRNFFSGSRAGKIKYWDGTKFLLICEVLDFHFGPIWVLKSSDDGKYLASGSQDKTVAVWKIGKNEKRKFKLRKDAFFPENLKEEAMAKIETKKEENKKEIFLAKIKEIFMEKEKLKGCNPDFWFSQRNLFRFFYLFRSLSGKEICFLLDSLTQNVLSFFLEEILIKSIQDFFLDPFLISNNIFSVIKQGRKTDQSSQKKVLFKKFEKKNKKDFKK